MLLVNQITRFLKQQHLNNEGMNQLDILHVDWDSRWFLKCLSKCDGKCYRPITFLDLYLPRWDWWISPCFCLFFFFFSFFFHGDLLLINKNCNINVLLSSFLAELYCNIFNISYRVQPYSSITAWLWKVVLIFKSKICLLSPSRFFTLLTNCVLFALIWENVTLNLFHLSEFKLVNNCNELQDNLPVL